MRNIRSSIKGTSRLSWPVLLGLSHTFALKSSSIPEVLVGAAILYLMHITAICVGFRQDKKTVSDHPVWVFWLALLHFLGISRQDTQTGWFRYVYIQMIRKTRSRSASILYFHASYRCAHHLSHHPSPRTSNDSLSLPFLTCASGASDRHVAWTPIARLRARLAKLVLSFPFEVAFGALLPDAKGSRQNAKQRYRGIIEALG